MNKLQTELVLLRWNLLLLASCLVIAGIFSYSIWHYHQQVAADARSAEQAATRMRTETSRLQSDEQEMRGKIVQYRDISARGIIGVEKRLDWVELMRAIQKDRKFLGLEYEIYPQLSLPSSVINNTVPGFEFMVSAMRLRMPLLHEEDLTHFIADLRSRAPAYIRVRDCKLTRSSESNLNQLTTEQPPQLDAECLIDWITIKDKSALGAAS